MSRPFNKLRGDGLLGHRLCRSIKRDEYPRVIKSFAMEIGGRSVPDTIGLAQWLTLVPEGGPARRLLTNDLRQLAAPARTEADELLKELASDRIEGGVLSTVRKVIETRSKHILDAADGARDQAPAPRV